MVFQLLYGSVSTYPFGHPTDLEILRSAWTENRLLGVTGYLLRAPSHFFQVLEGDAGVVRDLYRRIAGDPRHANVHILSTREIEARQFPDWAMGYAEIGTEELGRGLPALPADGQAGSDTAAGVFARIAEIAAQRGEMTRERMRKMH